jgi:tripartite-type tricarboxylate transporter receptor subunit TctC
MVKRKKWLIALAAAVLAAGAAGFVFRDAIWGVFFEDVPERMTVTAAWNPGSVADEVVRALAGGMDAQVTLQNITGANGANGADAVFGAPRDGESVLSTGLSAFVTSEAMGFAARSHREWESWLCAFSPVVVVVAAGSPYRTMEDLMAALRENPGRLRGANPGFGTVSYAAAELFSMRALLEFEFIDHAGSNPAINALLDGGADFALLISAEAAGRLRSGELLALGAFGETGFAPSVAGISERLDAVLPFGEGYGLFVPADVSNRRLNGLDAVIRKAAASEGFTAFLHNWGLEPVAPDRKQSRETAERLASLLCWTLYDAGYLPTNPDTLAIRRPVI